MALRPRIAGRVATPARTEATLARGRLVWLLGLTALAWGWALFADASVTLANRKVEAEYWGSVAVDDGSAVLSRFTLKPSARWQIGDMVQAELALRGEYAADRTGLGSLDTYSDLSRPLIDRRKARVEIDRATLTWQTDAGSLALGKQSVPWGVLDGVQITDRFDAVRRREFVLTDVRPDRLTRWGLRARTGVAGIDVELAAMADPTVTQLSRRGDVFEPLAPRLRGGLQANAPTLPIAVSDRDRYADDLTAGLRLGRRFGDVEATVLTLRGPDTDPLLTLALPGGTPTVRLDFPRRTLYGATLEGAIGDAIWRMELAHVPDQPVNLEGQGLLASADRPRWLAGVGVDWNAPGGWFVNAQLAVDRVKANGLDLVRPDQDVIATLRAQRGFRHDTVRIRAELLGTLSDADGVLRPAIEWRATDLIGITLGGDLLFGGREGLFGQYRDESRVWVRFALSL